MAALRLSAADAELMRLDSIAADMAERLQHLERQAEAAADLGHPGPTPTDLAHVRRLLAAAEAQADAARRKARGDRPRRRS